MFGLPNLVLMQSTFSNCMRDLVFQSDMFQSGMFQVRHACEQITQVCSGQRCDFNPFRIVAIHTNCFSLFIFFPQLKGAMPAAGTCYAFWQA